MREARSWMDAAEAVARVAGEVALRHYHRGVTVETKGDGTPVSVADRQAEEAARAWLEKHCPEDGILGEELGTTRPEARRRWILDPIDGTTNYLYGHPGYGISIAVEVDGETAVGVVHDPLHGDRFTAVRGGEATRNGEPIRVSDEIELGSALIATGFAYTAAERVAQAEVLASVIGSIRDVRRMGAAAVDLCSVACGRVDGYYERGLKRWDLAAGSLIAATAGARVSELDDGTVIAAAPGVYDALRAAVIAAGSSPT